MINGRIIGPFLLDCSRAPSNSPWEPDLAENQSRIVSSTTNPFVLRRLSDAVVSKPVLSLSKGAHGPTVHPFECGTLCLPQDNGFETLPFLSTNGFGTTNL